MVKKHSIEEFVAKARDVHGDRYDYSLFDYVNCRTNGKIVCKKHGVFEQQPRCHVSLKHGCQFCGSGKLLLEEFISKAREIHGERYDYSLFDYVDSLTKSKITCQKHGVFEQMPDTHIRQKGGCYKCGRVVYDTEKFVSKAREFHGDKYDYSLFEYRHSHIKGKIICPIHGIFELTPSRHLHGSGRNKKKIPSGCQTCGSEKLISRLLRQHYGDISAVITHEESREWQEGG